MNQLALTYPDRAGFKAAEMARDLLNYDPETGVFTWRNPRRASVKIGSKAGSLRADGYVAIRFEGRRVKAHRLAWLYVHGRWPVDQLDHINGSRDDNRIANLRECSNAENQQNRLRARADNRSGGLLGASFSKAKGRWHAQIKAHGEHRQLGHFDSAEEAHAAYLAAKAEMHKFSMLPPVPKSGSVA